jgi:hypothetical protein
MLQRQEKNAATHCENNGVPRGDRSVPEGENGVHCKSDGIKLQRKFIDPIAGAAMMMRGNGT